MKPIVAGLSLALLAVPLAADSTSTTALTPDQIQQSVLSSMDPKADPCDDFYRYACGGWLDAAELPADQPRLGAQLLDHRRAQPGVPAHGCSRTRRRTRAATRPERRDRRLLRRLHGRGGGRERRRSRRSPAWLAEVDTVDDRPRTCSRSPASCRRSAPRRSSTSASTRDFKDPRTVVAHLSQGGLGLPDRDYYLARTRRSRELREAYEKHVARMLGSSRRSRPSRRRRRPKAILAFETELATRSRARVERMRDPTKMLQQARRRRAREARARAPLGRASSSGTGRPDVDGDQRRHAGVLRRARAPSRWPPIRRRCAPTCAGPARHRDAEPPGRPGLRGRELRLLRPARSRGQQRDAAALEALRRRHRQRARRGGRQALRRRASSPATASGSRSR